MATDKELLKKLYKIARNQQKIIRKLAQDTAITTSINTGIVQNVVDKLAGAGSAQVQSATLKTATDATNNVVKTLIMSVQVLNEDTFSRARGNIEMALKRTDVLVDDQGNRHTAQAVSINTF